MSAWIAFLLSVPAFAALSLAMDRHHDQVWGATPTPQRQWPLRAIGIGFLLLSLLLCLQSWRTSVAVAAWLGVLTFAALLVGIVLTYAPAKLRALAVLCTVLGALAACL